MLNCGSMTSPRAASWVHDVINVFMDALEMEAALLRRGDTSWRFYNEQLEYIRPLSAYLTRHGQHIFRDFLIARPAVAERLMPHDDLRSKLEVAATVAARELLAATDLRARVEDARTRYLLKHPKDVPTGAYAAEKHAELVAEHLVNEVKELSANYTDALFWKEHGSEFNSVLNIPVCQELRRLRQALLSYDLDVTQWLAAYSFSLCQEFDIPAASSVVTGVR
jgi:hypothetical protein